MIQTLPAYGIRQLRESIGVLECELQKPRGNVCRCDRILAGIHGLADRPKSYGNALARSAREGGSALGNAMFLSHGSKPGNGPITIFDTLSEMKSAGFQPYSEMPQPIEQTSLTETEQSLLKNLHAAMNSFVFMVNSNAALQYMKRDNTSKFRNGLGPSFLQSTVDCGLFDNVESARVAVTSYVTSLPSIPTVLNMERPGSEDLLQHFVGKAVQASGNASRYAFVRSGFTGFDVATR